MEELSNGSLLTNNYTRIFYKEDPETIAPCYFRVETLKEEPLAHINFQHGPVKEKGVNGVSNEDLINMVLKRLSAFQETEYKCRENAEAITKLEESLMWLRKRTSDREIRNVVGASSV